MTALEYGALLKPDTEKTERKLSARTAIGAGTLDPRALLAEIHPELFFTPGTAARGRDDDRIILFQHVCTGGNSRPPCPPPASSVAVGLMAGLAMVVVGAQFNAAAQPVRRPAAARVTPLRYKNVCAAMRGLLSGAIVLTTHLYCAQAGGSELNNLMLTSTKTSSGCPAIPARLSGMQWKEIKRDGVSEAPNLPRALALHSSSSSRSCSFPSGWKAKSSLI